MAERHIQVNIFGNEYSLVSDNDEAYLKQIAEYIDHKMRVIDRESSIKSSNKIAILAALNIADELFQERLHKERLLEQVNEDSKKLNRTLLEALEE